MGRKILFVTVDQQRYDALGCNGGAVARTPVVDALAATGTSYDRAQPANVVCMPSRATMITGQHVHTHGVWMNGVALPPDAPSVAAVLHDGGYATALFGKAHFEPALDPFLRFGETRMGMSGATGPHRGFDRMELATHSARGASHYAGWLRANHPEHLDDLYPVVDLVTLEVNPAPGGDTGAPQLGPNPIPRDLYHTDWVADRAIAWLDSLDADTDWFCWVSFPDPHHPWDPPAAERHRVDWRQLDLPAGYPETADERAAVLDGKPRHWRLWYDGDLVSNYEAPAAWVPATMTADQVREVNAMIHTKNELIDEALGRVLAAVDRRGWAADTDVLYTTDHGELQGDFGLLFKGPYHVDSLLRLPLVWRPAPNAMRAEHRPEPAAAHRVAAPVGLVDLAPTFCAIAGLEVPEWMEGSPLPRDEAEAERQRRRRALTVWDSHHPNGHRVHLRSITEGGWLATTYLPGSHHDGTEGELYDLAADPLQQHNRWDDPSCRAGRNDLLADLADHLPSWPEPHRSVVAPV